MSFGNKKVDPLKVYTMFDRPPVEECGGVLDAEGNDTYWGRSLAVQADEADANINSIMTKYVKTGVLNAAIKDNPSYGNFAKVPDYHAAMSVVAKAHEQFDMLDARVRARFSNDPSKFLEFMSDEKNHDEWVKLGLAKEKPIPPQPAKNGGAPVEPPPSA